MTISLDFLLKGTLWTIGAYAIGTGLRMLTNVVLAHLLTPEIFGTMLIVYSLRIGIELISDVGIGQNIVYHKNADDPDFYNTAWSLQLLRSGALWLLFLLAAAPMAWFYQAPILVYVVPITAFGIVITGLQSVSKTLLQKRLQIRKLNVFDTGMAIVSSAAHISMAFVTPSVWALVCGGLIANVVSTVCSYFLLPDVKQRFFISKDYVRQILHFGKWIFLSSIVFFLSTYIDRLFLGRAIPLELLGVYGIARSISDLSGNLVLRLGNVVLFPFIASHSQVPRAELREQLASMRAKFMLVAAIGFSFLVVTADLVIRLLYDTRYQEATWILPVLIIGSWFSVVANVNESTLLGLGKPSYTAVSNASKLVFLGVGLWLSVMFLGFVGAVIVVALADVCRYVPTLVGQVRERFSFGRQDLYLTLAMVCSVLVLEWIRWASGFGTSFDTFPLRFG